MIPGTLNDANITATQEYEAPPSKTYRLDFTNKRIIGKIDDADAVNQFIKKVLNTDKYSYEIYNWYYGNELYTLIGRPYEYIIAEIPRIVEEALLVDSRILSIDSWQFSKTLPDKVEGSCMVHTIYGSMSYNMEVSI